MDLFEPSPAHISEPASQHTDRDSSDVDLNLLNDVLLVLDGNSKKLGGCSLALAERKLCLIQDIQIETGQSSSCGMAIDKILAKIAPSKVIISSRLDETITKELEKKSSVRNFTIDIVKSKSFSPKLAVRDIDKILNEVNSTNELYSSLTEIKYSREASITLGSFGALMSAVEACEVLDVRASLFQFVEYYSPVDTMYLDPETLYALHIFSANDALLDQKEKKRSLFDLLDHTNSTLGYKILKSWFRAPLAKIELINERLNTVETLISEENVQYLEELVKHQKKIPNLNYTLSSIIMGKPSIQNWSQLVTFLENGIGICEVVETMKNKEGAAILQRLVQQVDIEPLRELLGLIKNVIDFDLSTQWKRVYVRDGLVVKLDDYRIDYDQLEKTLDEAASEICSKYPRLYSDTLNVVYMPQVGYLISVDVANQNDVPEEWEEVFTTATNMYFKDECTTSMDQNLGDVYQLIIDLEIEVLHGLKATVFENSKMLLKYCELFAELDCYMSFASVFLLNDYVRPEIVEDNVIEIKNGRHPIFEHFVPSYISNSTNIQNHQISIVTGANASGKSLYLSQIGTIVYLAHIGCFVPAEFAKIGLTDKILSRLATLESLEKCESSYFIDLQEMSKCLRLGSERSLLLIDEFGKGTDVIGGPALLGAIIEELSINQSAPKTFITTHFHELFKDGIIEESPNVVHNHMDVIFQPQNGEAKLTYLYELKDGLTSNSFGINCAKACGIPQEILKRAYEILNEDQPQSLGAEMDELNVNRAKYITREFLSWDLESQVLQSTSELKEILQNILQKSAESM